MSEHTDKTSIFIHIYMPEKKLRTYRLRTYSSQQDDLYYHRIHDMLNYFTIFRCDNGTKFQGVDWKDAS